MKGRNTLFLVTVLLLALVTSGCAVGFYKGRPSDKVKINELKDELSRLREAKLLLEKKLSKEIDANQVTVNMSDRGLVITFMAEVLFNSGKSKLSPEGMNMLNKVAKILKEEDINNDIGIEGHTDNVPIKHSGWKSNWELSTARSTSVLHYLLDRCALSPEKLSATGYGEYRPVVSNATAEGREKNRRVEIIIKPQKSAETESAMAEPAKGANAGYIK
ncbi:MAG: OmpA family protein [Candidatus Omnitrophica bacterium]|nr:OmpA family protein [Candidatus Omnitrophota bacterium]